VSDVERLLTLVNGAALHKALREQGVGVSYRTVARWIGATPSAKPPAEIMPALEAVLGTTKEPPRPEWAERLLTAVDSVLANQSKIIAEQQRTAESVAPLDRLLNVEGLRDWLEGMPQPSDADPLDLPDTGVTGTGAPGGRASS
jgi:hypothetical protein